jgi:hypothetical protein
MPLAEGEEAAMAKVDGRNADREPIPLGLWLFCLSLMAPACAINAAFIAIAIPATAPYGVNALLIAGLIGAVVGILPAQWLARRIHEGLSGNRASD